MKIELCEDNGFLNDGKPTLVVLIITDDLGKMSRIPYQADKTIQNLYSDVGKFLKSMGHSVIDPSNVIQEQLPSGVDGPLPFNKEGKLEISNEIEREDIVKVVHLEKDIDGNVNEELELNKEYRIINIIKQQGVLLYYELLDDEKDNKIRIPCLPKEVSLVRKHFKQPPRVQNFEETMKCSNCTEDNSLMLNVETNQYESDCSKCGAKLIKERPMKDVATK